MYLAVFGDVHGNLDDLYTFCRMWQEKTGKVISAVLQVGDMGVFRRTGPLDKATVKFAKEDPSELGCSDYIEGTKEATHLTVFVRGNHEDFEFLSGAGHNHIDPFGTIKHLDSGEIFKIAAGSEMATVSGLGGVFSGAPQVEKRQSGKYFTDDECGRLFRLSPEKVDILLFHEAPYGRGLRHSEGTGSKKITRIIEDLRPRFALYGHYGNPPDPFRSGRTLCVGMNNREALHLPRRHGGMGIVDTSAWSFAFVGKHEFD
jgi:Icc-related predicted phosphoesterase